MVEAGLYGGDGGRIIIMVVDVVLVEAGLCHISPITIRQRTRKPREYNAFIMLETTGQVTCSTSVSSVKCCF